MGYGKYVLLDTPCASLCHFFKSKKNVKLSNTKYLIIPISSVDFPGTPFSDNFTGQPNTHWIFALFCE